MKPIKALIIPCEGEPFLKTIVSLEEMQQAVGGYIENLNLKHGTMYVDEDAGRKHPKPPVNRRATMFFEVEQAHDYFSTAILGDVIIVGPPKNGDNTDVYKEYAKFFIKGLQ